MATLLEIEELINETVKDTVFSNLSVVKYINQGINEIAGGAISCTGLIRMPPLPDLFKIETVETSTSLAYVEMPTTYQRNLQFVVDSDGKEITIYNSIIEFSSDYPLMNNTGDVQAVVEQGENLYYQGIPSAAETLTLHYFRKPVAISGGSDIPDGIPEYLQIPLLVNYVALKCYELIGNEINIKKHQRLFTDALMTLELSIQTDNTSLFLSA